MSDHCEAKPVRIIAPKLDALRAIHGPRLACTKHLHWVRRLFHLDLGDERARRPVIMRVGSERRKPTCPDCRRRPARRRKGDQTF